MAVSILLTRFPTLPRPSLQRSGLFMRVLCGKRWQWYVPSSHIVISNPTKVSILTKYRHNLPSTQTRPLSAVSLCTMGLSSPAA